MLQLKSFALLTCLLALSLGTVPVCAQAPADVGFIALDPEDPGKKPYLAALALHHGEKYVAALAAAEGVITNHPKSKWFRKARFLKAETLVALRRYEAAETIYAEEAQRLLGEERKHEIAGVLTRFAENTKSHIRHMNVLH